MKVLHISTEPGWRGGENQLRLLIEGSKNHIEHHVACKKDDKLAQKLRGNVSLLELEPHFALSINNALAIAQYCRNQDIKIIDAQSSKGHSLGLMACYLQKNLQLVVHRRVDFLPGRNFIGKLKYLNPKVKRFIAISQAIYDILKNYGIDENKLRLVRSAIDQTPYMQLSKENCQANFRKKWNLSQNTVLIGSAAALSKQKDFPTMFKAVASLLEKGVQNFHLFIAGDGEEKESLLQLVQTLGISGHVTFLGWLEHVQEFLAACDIFALSSKTEGLGTIIQEACYAKCFICATSAGGIGEMIEHGTSGYLSKPQDINSFSDNLLLAIRDNKTRAKFIENAWKKIDAQFSLQAMVRGNLAVYSELISSN